MNQRKEDPETRALRLLARRPATEAIGYEIHSLRALKARGWAEVTHRWNDVVNGRTWECQRVSITASGRDELARRLGHV